MKNGVIDGAELATLKTRAKAWIKKQLWMSSDFRARALKDLHQLESWYHPPSSATLYRDTRKIITAITQSAYSLELNHKQIREKHGKKIAKLFTGMVVMTSLESKKGKHRNPLRRHPNTDEIVDDKGDDVDTDWWLGLRDALDELIEPKRMIRGFWIRDFIDESWSEKEYFARDIFKLSEDDDTEVDEEDDDEGDEEEEEENSMHNGAVADKTGQAGDGATKGAAKLPTVAEKAKQTDKAAVKSAKSATQQTSKKKRKATDNFQKQVKHPRVDHPQAGNQPRVDQPFRPPFRQDRHAPIDSTSQDVIDMLSRDLSETKDRARKAASYANGLAERVHTRDLALKATVEDMLDSIDKFRTSTAVMLEVLK